MAKSTISTNAISVSALSANAISVSAISASATSVRATSVRAQSKFRTKILSDNTGGVNTLRKPLKMTATLKRRALKQKTARREVQIPSGGGGAADLLTLSQPK
jgi:hypothetical protein